VKPEGGALVTGAGRGLGRAIALELARRGFDAVAGLRDPAAAADPPRAPEGAAGSLRVAALDVCRPETIEIPDDLRVLVNNAGVDDEYLPVEHAPDALWRRMFETNLFGLLAVTRRAIPVLRANGGGVICNLTSASLFTAVPFYAAYRASKAAVSALGETLCSELAPFGIRVVEVAPGPIDTDMLAASDRLPEGARHAGYEQLAEWMLRGRRGVASQITPPERAAAAVVEAILDDDAPLRNACDPLGRAQLEAWRSQCDEDLLRALLAATLQSPTG
jgi:NAD(P)-dependent dehydrogenase (short-subunit alcohol dehydrogenase family)